jgi:hypothetical protein
VPFCGQICVQVFFFIVEVEYSHWSRPDVSTI